MSSKSSMRSSRSYASSAGETQISSHSSSGGSSRHRRARAAGGGLNSEPRVPPAKMSATERIELLRNGMTRLQYVCERQLHMSSLDQAGGPKVQEYFDLLREKLPVLLAMPSTPGSPTTGGPRQLQAVAVEIAELSTAARVLLGAVEKDTDKAVAVYEGLELRHLREASSELHQMQELLRPRKAGEVAQDSRMNTDLLRDLVAFHVTEFDAFAQQRVEAFAREMRNEGAMYSGSVMTDASQRASPIGVSSVFLMDVAIGVRPGRSARMVLEHARMELQRIDNRLQVADGVLQEIQQQSATAEINASPDLITTTAAAGAKEAEQARRESQRREFTIMKDRLRHALSELDRLSRSWTDEELSIFNQAASGGHDLFALAQAKQLKECEVIEEAQEVHDRAVHACLPVATPQYCRRYGETYSHSCHIRIGFHFLPDAANAIAHSLDHHHHHQQRQQQQRSSLKLYTASSSFLALMRKMDIPEEDHEKLSCLVPSSEQVWLSFSEFPEMVKGARCALRDVHTKLDHFRALEEQKEVGGYFLMRGGERILRALMMQRCNVAINIYREKFQSQGPHFSSKAVVIRCKRSSGLTIQNYFYYTTIGEVVFSFARKVVWHLPVPLLLLAMSTQNASTVELFRLLTLGMPAGDGSHPARVEALLQHHRQRPYGALTHFLDYITVIGRMYREYHQNSNTFHFLPQYAKGTQCHHDAWYGMFMLRRHVLPHLNNDATTPDLAPDATPEMLTQWLSHALLDELNKKFDAMVAIVRQLYLFIDGKIEHQGNDVPAYQELFTVSQALIAAFEVCLNKYMASFAFRLGRYIPSALFHSLLDLSNAVSKDAEESMRQLTQFSDYCARRSGSDPLDLMYRLLITGNMTLDREEDFYCPQTSGWVVMAEHLNFYRFFEQLRCIHRGKTIADMRSSEVRKYPCEAYGFICMVHSPDGEDCGVLNHLSVATIMSNSFAPCSTQKGELQRWIVSELPALRSRRTATTVIDCFVDTVPVWVEGELIGYVTPAEAVGAAAALRVRKAILNPALIDANGVVRRKDATPLNTLEVVYVPPHSKDPSGLYLFYDCGRLMRPVQRIEAAPLGSETRDGTGATSTPFPLVFIGTWEQSWLDIASVPSDLLDGVEQLNRKYEYMEQNGSNLISLTSTTIPFFEYNCSPRNLFQCGLSKQSAGTQMQALAWRKEAKLFRMYCPQRYISRTLPMDFYGLDDVNLGVNAVIAILAYTGYDLDDAVILNSTASQRGMLNAGITVAKIINAAGKGDKDDVYVFHNLLSTGERFTPELEPNGLPPKRASPALAGFSFQRDHKYPGLTNSSDVYCCAKRVERIDPFTNQKVYEYTRHQATKWRHFDKGEDAWVHQVIPLVYNGPDPTSVLAIFRIPRPPTVGDKFSSRHGQKGTLPLHIRAHDLPFATASGITPDVIINPHAFPSRMTVGMVLEIMTAKVGAVEGRFIDNSAWSTVDEQPRVAEVIGESLVRSGYNRYGRERLIDGISGEEMDADVFMGVCGYQRLRHMVSDKWQARARTDAHTYRAVTKTGQPVKGRKRHGGVRVGEMERDGLLSHGISEVVLDRLLHVSDKTKAFICPNCGSLLSIYERHATEYSTWKTCRFCGTGASESNDSIAMVEIPQVLRLWAAELTSIGIRVVLKTAEEASM